MLRALNEVKKGEMDVNRATDKNGVPLMIFNNHIAGRVIHGTNIGHMPYLKVEEQKGLVNFQVTFSKLGYGKKSRGAYDC